VPFDRRQRKDLLSVPLSVAGKEARAMRVRMLPLACLLLLGSAGFVWLAWSHAQTPAPSSAVVPRPASAPATDAAPSHDLSKLSELHQQMYLSARRGAEWLARMNQVKGRFVHGWRPDLDVPLEGDHALRQAGAAFALARAARFFHDERQVAR